MNPDDTHATLDPDPQPEDPEFQSLHRSLSKRKIAGVAGGIAERFDIDPNIVRVCFALLTALWGLGAAIYLAMWALVPEAGTPSSAIEGRSWLYGSNETKLSWFRSVLLVVVVGIGLIFAAKVMTPSHIGDGIGLVWLVFLVALAVITLRLPKSRLSFGRLFGATAVVILSVAFVAAGSILGYVSMTGVPIAGGVGQRLYLAFPPKSGHIDYAAWK